jgi:hypothetical protein
MKNLQHIEKSGFHRGQYVGYGGGKVWSIHASTSSNGKWRAFNQRNPNEYRYGWTLTELDAYFHIGSTSKASRCVKARPPLAPMKWPRQPNHKAGQTPAD